LIIVHDGLTSDGIIPTDDRIRVYYIAKEYTYPKDDKKAEWLSGPCNALNHALSKVNSDSDWIARIDDDDEWNLNALKELIAHAKGGNADFVSAFWKDDKGNRPEPYYLPELNLDGDGYLGGVQTWLYKAKYRNIIYNPYSWEKSWNANNELDWFERFYKTEKPRIVFLRKTVCTIRTRPGETEIGSKAYLRGDFQ